MKQVGSRSILAVVACLVIVLPQFGFAEEGTQWGSTPTQTYSLEVPALSVGDAPQSTQSSQTNPSTVEQNFPPIPGNDSPLSLRDVKSDEIPQKLTEEESMAVLVRVDELINMVLGSLQEQSDRSSEKSGEAYNALNSEIQKYEMARDVIRSYSQSVGSETAPSVIAVLEQVGEILGGGLSNTPGPESSSLTPAEKLIQRFARYAAASVRRVRERMTEDASLPEAKIFSAEESPELKSEKREGTREERSVLSREVDRPLQEHYQVLGSVVLNREMAKTYELLNPPQRLHPFLRWLFYGRHLTQVRAERYLAARAKVKEICMRAKAGEGLIRYKGKVMEMFLPLPGDENGMAFELVRRM